MKTEKTEKIKLADIFMQVMPPSQKSMAKNLAKMTGVALVHGCAQGKAVDIPGVGVLFVRTMRARNVRNPKTGELIAKPQTRKVVFRPSKALKEAVASSVA